MKSFKKLVKEFYSYPPTTDDEKKFLDIHKVQVVDYPVKNDQGLPFRDDNIKHPGLQHKKPASYEPPHEPTNVYKNINDLNKKFKFKRFDEQAIQVDEVSKQTLGRYINASVKDVESRKKNAADFAALGVAAKKEGDKEGATKMFDRWWHHAGKALNREKGIKTAVNKLTKEEIDLEEKTLTPAEIKKREEVAKAIERENPKMPMSMKMAIATKTAKRVAEQEEDLANLNLIRSKLNLSTINENKEEETVVEQVATITDVIQNVIESKATATLSFNDEHLEVALNLETAEALNHARLMLGEEDRKIFDYLISKGSEQFNIVCESCLEHHKEIKG